MRTANVQNEKALKIPTLLPFLRKVTICKYEHRLGLVEMSLASQRDWNERCKRIQREAINHDVTVVVKAVQERERCF